MYWAGIERFRDREKKAKAGGYAHVLPGPHGLEPGVLDVVGEDAVDWVPGALDLVAQGIRDWLQWREGKRGPRPEAYYLLCSTNTKTVAQASLRAIIDRLLQAHESTIQDVAEDVGESVECRARLDEKLRTDHDRWVVWTKQDKMRVGRVCLEIVKDCTSLIEYEQRSKKRKFMYVVVLTEKVEELIADWHYVMEELAPIHLPMVWPPAPWTNVHDGGYLQKDLFPGLSLVKARHPDQLDGINPKACPEVFRAVNALQETSWRINSRLLDVARELAPLEEELPKTKDGPKGFRRQTAVLLRQAGDFVDEERFWLPVQLDFRGRLYYVPFVDPQGADLARSLLEFADGKPLVDNAVGLFPESDGFTDLARYGWSLYGRKGLVEIGHLMWSQENLDRIRNAAANPLKDTWWREAKEPWRFLRWCMEWTEAQGPRNDYVSHLPIYRDGTCNGIQHIAALLRDELLGRAVNLVPSEARSRLTADAAAGGVLSYEEADEQYRQITHDQANDFYNDVVTALRTTLEATNDSVAKAWLAFPVDRALVKRAVMTVPYGATQNARFGQFKTAIWTRADHGFGDSDDVVQAAAYLAALVSDEIEKMAPKCIKFMEAMKKIGRQMAKEGLHLEWTAPSGFPVRQRQFKTIEARVETQARKLRIRSRNVRIRLPTKKADPHGSAKGAAPNLIHSIDAAHLVKTICRCIDKGATHCGVVHDSFATHAADVALLDRALRWAWKEIHTPELLAEHHRIWSHQARTPLEAMPEPGRLDVGAFVYADHGFD